MHGPAKSTLLAVVENFHVPLPAIKTLATKVRAGFLARTANFSGGELATITASDLTLLFTLYDRYFFSSALARAVGGKLTFRVSDRMTRAGGKLRFYPAKIGSAFESFELVVSRRLLLENFSDKRPVEVNGVDCADRVSALQAIFEHELLHLVELHLLGHSRCKSAAFRERAKRLFGHLDVTHSLSTKCQIQRMQRLKSPVKVGDMVLFTYRGAELPGRVNRITKRATVLVESRLGSHYTDGKRYRKYYVPLARLEVVKEVRASVAKPWWLYLLECRGGMVYAGVAVDVVKRFVMHESGKGARFTRANPPLRILAAERFEGRSQAQKAEAKLKGLRKPQKLKWASLNPWKAAGPK
jgi:predicted GIY-YIG superfamily endonuclease